MFELDPDDLEMTGIKIKLDYLDKFIPRIIEDMISAGIYQPIPQQLDIIAQKNELRSILSK